MALAGNNDRVNNGRALTGAGVADEQPVLLADGRRPDGIFNEVVVQPGLPMVEMGGERHPLSQEVIAGFAPRQT